MWDRTDQGHAFWSTSWDRPDLNEPASDEHMRIIRRWAVMNGEVVAPASDTPTVTAPAPAKEYPDRRTLRGLLRQFSQRRVSNDLGIPRTTLQDLIARYWPDKAKRPAKKD